MFLERLVVEVEITFNYVSNDLELGVTRERHLPRQHDVKDHAHRPNVNLGVVVLQEHLWRNIIWLKSRQESSHVPLRPE